MKQKMILLAVAMAAGSMVANGAVDLAKLDETRAGYKAKMADEKVSARDKARAQMYLLDLDATTCPESEAAAKRKALEDYLAKPILGLKPSDQINLLQSLRHAGLETPLPNAYEMTERFYRTLGAEDQKALAWTMTSWRIEFMRYMMTRPGREASLDEAMSHEARLKVIDAALANPQFADKALKLKEMRFQALDDLGSDVEAEKYALQVLASTNRQDKLSFHQKLAEFYVDRASRFYSKPDAATLKKAAAQYRAYNALYGKDPSQRILHKIATILRDAGDAEGARQALAEEEVAIASIKRLRPEQEANMKRDIALVRGDLLFASKDYAGALAVWEPYGEAIRKIGGREAIVPLERICRALSAVGRRPDMIPYLEALTKHGNKYTRLRYEYLLGAVKAEQPAASAAPAK